MPTLDNSTDRIVSDAAKLAKANKELRPERKEPTGGFKFLSEQVLLVDGTGAVGWTRLDLSAHVPNCTGVILNCFVRKAAPSGNFDVRRERGAIEFRAGSASDGSSTNQLICEVTPDRTVDYKTEAMTEYKFWLLGYYTN